MAYRDLSTAREWTCDGCGKPAITTEAGEQPDGFHGEAYEQESWGVQCVATWWACTRSCIRPAVLGALEHAADEKRAGG